MKNEPTAQPKKLAEYTLTKEVEGVQLTASISPCSWMYDNYGLQLSVAMHGGGTVTVHDSSTRFASATSADVERLFDTVRICQCKRCGSPAFDPQSAKTNRNGLCETCFMQDLRKQLDKATQAENRKLARLDAKRKKEGYTHRVSAWIHPEDGDDYQMEFWLKNTPTEAQIKALLKRNGSTVLDDYQIVAL